jgi:hypothetical protein
MLRPTWLLDARQRLRAGSMAPEAYQEIEDPLRHLPDDKVAVGLVSTKRKITPEVQAAKLRRVAGVAHCVWN